MNRINTSILCRLCLNSCRFLVDIFEENGKHGYVAAEAIEELLHFHVTQEDGYPQQVCGDCLNKLTEFKMFKLQCHHSHESFDKEFRGQEGQGDISFPSASGVAGSIKVEKVESDEEAYDMDAMEGITAEVVIKTESLDETFAQNIVASEAMEDGLGPSNNGNSGGVCRDMARIRNVWGTVGSRVGGMQAGRLPSNSFPSIQEMQGGLVVEGGSSGIRHSGLQTGPGGATEEFVCPQCGKVFAYLCYMNKHIRTTHNRELLERRHECNVCKMRFAKRGNLERHAMIHNGVRSFACERCNKAFFHHSELLAHASSHLRATPYICDYCQKGFSDKLHLVEHVSRHTNQRPFPCTTCGKPFGTAKNLRLHQKIHELNPSYSALSKVKESVDDSPVDGESPTISATTAGDGLDRQQTCPAVFYFNSSKGAIVEEDVMKFISDEIPRKGTEYVIDWGNWKNTRITLVKVGGTMDECRNALVLFEKLMDSDGVSLQEAVELCEVEDVAKERLKTNGKIVGKSLTEVFDGNEVIVKEEPTDEYERVMAQPRVMYGRVNCEAISLASQGESDLRGGTSEVMDIITTLKEELNKSGTACERAEVCLKFSSIFNDREDEKVMLYKGYNVFIGEEALKMVLIKSKGNPVKLQRHLLLTLKGPDYVQRHSACGQRSNAENGHPRVDDELIGAVESYVKWKFPRKHVPDIKKTFNKLAANLRLAERRKNGITKKARPRKEKFTQAARAECEECNKTFTSHVYFKRHQRKHSGDLFGCLECGKTFVHKYSLKQHEALHREDGGFACDVCGKKFDKKNHLRVHTMLHTGERPYECEYCTKRFHVASHLRVHLKLHTGERSFYCDYCGKGFVQKSHYVDHVRVHTGERPFACTECSRAFCQRQQLRQHMKTHNKGGGPVRSRAKKAVG